MDIQEILTILAGKSKDLKILQKNVGYVHDFLKLIEKLDQLPQIKSRFHEENRNYYSLYKAVGEGIAPSLIEKHLIGFFGAPVKRSGKTPSLKLKFYPSIKLMGKISREQTFFIRKLQKGEFFAAVWPWVRKPGFVTIHMGYYSKSLSDDDFLKLEDVVKTNAGQNMAKEMESGLGGQIRGINLATFLQMSEQEKNTCSLGITAKNKTGRLYLENGELIDGETENLKGKDAVFEIIKWDNVTIEIEKYRQKRKNVINTPLLNVLLEGLKQKDEEQALPSTDQTEAPKPAEDSSPGNKSQKPQSFESGDKNPETPQVQSPPDTKSANKSEDLVLYEDLNKKPIFKYILITLIIMGMVGVSVWGAQYWLESRHIKKQYDKTMQSVENAGKLKAKEKLLIDFIAGHSHAFYTSRANKKLKAIREQQDDLLYEEIVSRIKQLPLTKDYDVKAKAIYDKYISQFPLGKHAAAVKQKIAELPDKVEESRFTSLTTTNFKSKKEKIKAHKKYLADYPKGKHREKVELFLVLEIEERYEEIQKQLKVCENQGKWADCAKLCNDFLAIFENTYRTEEIQNIKDSIEVKQHLAQLRTLAEKLEPDHQAIKKLYQDYLGKNPGFSGKKTIEKEIQKRKTLINEARAWQAVVAYTEDTANSFIEKIENLDDYIDKNPSGAYSQQARRLREKIRQERLEHDRRQRWEAERQQREAVLRDEIIKKQKQTSRLNQEILTIQKKLYNHQGVFEYKNNGIFKDKRTGLTWCILDSHTVLGKCLNYEEALQYVDSLDTGGKTNWRLPSFSELASLYKNQPFFPTDSLKWFWTRERVVKGYHEMVGIVSSAPQKVFNRKYVSTKECATVHAVHP